MSETLLCPLRRVTTKTANGLYGCEGYTVDTVFLPCYGPKCVLAVPGGCALQGLARFMQEVPADEG